MNSKMSLTCVLIVVFGILAASATADDMLPPDWRGEPGTIMAEWSSWGQAGVGPGMLVLLGDQVTANPGDFDPMATAAYAHWNSSVVVLDSWAGRTGVLEVNPGGGLGPVSFGLRNYDNDNPLKRIRIQITFMGSGVMDFYVASGSGGGIPGDPPWPTLPWTKRDAIVATSYQHDDGWTTSAYDLSIEPNPDWEVIMLDWGYTGPDTWVSWIDQVVIDTQCVPEPATLSLLGLGALAVIRRRRK